MGCFPAWALWGVGPRAREETVLCAPSGQALMRAEVDCKTVETRTRSTDFLKTIQSNLTNFKSLT